MTPARGLGKGADAIPRAVEKLRQGGVVVFPTETSYGVGVDITNTPAIQRLRALKKRARGKPFPIIGAHENQLAPYVEIDARVHTLLHQKWSGPITLIAPKKKTVPEAISKDGVAFRIAVHPVARAICEALGKPITATSANISGETPVYSLTPEPGWMGEVDVLVDAGELPEQPASTIYDTRSRKIIREGKVTGEEINAREGI